MARHDDQQPYGGDESSEWSQPGPFEKKRRLRVGFGFYLVSVLIVAVAVFVVSMVQYFPGHRQSYKLKQAVKGANYVYVGIRIPKDELKKRNVNPLTMEDELKKMLKDMGAGSSRVEINPDRTAIPYER